MAVPALAQRVDATLRIDPDADAFEFERKWYTWGALAAGADELKQVIEPGTRVGVMLRNQPPHIGLLLGLLSSGACVVAINPSRGDTRVRADLDAVGVTVLAGTSEDLAAYGASSAATVRIASDDVGAITVEGTVPETASANPGVAVEMLTSGTTGPPKRVPLGYDMLLRVMVGAAKHYTQSQETELQLRSGVILVNAPLVHLGGIFRVLQCVFDGRSFCLLDRFQLEPWLDAVRRHRPRTVSLVPTALRMVLDADVDPGDLASIRSVISGTAPLAPEDADAFREKYGIPVLTNYAATEFGGGVAGWNLADHEKYWETKKGSVGRAYPGSAVRVVDPDTGSDLPTGEVGLLEVKPQQLGDRAGWTRTTDLARLDEDGFLWIVGRADQAIIRGGFKVLPDVVRSALEADPRVRAAAVVGRPDARLGAVPVAAVEVRDPGAGVTPEALLADLGGVLAPYEIPVELRIVDELPRTPSGKVELVAVGEILGG